jgi:hypothetical protein
MSNIMFLLTLYQLYAQMYPDTGFLKQSEYFRPPKILVQTQTQTKSHKYQKDAEYDVFL